MHLSLAAWWFLGATCVFLPWLSVRGALRLRERATSAMPTRAQHLGSFAISQGAMLLLALLAAHREWITLFPRPTIQPLPIALAAAFVALALGTLPMRWGWRKEEHKRRLLWMLPQKTADLWWWLGVALVAGIVEEIVFRGVLFTLLVRMVGSWWIAVAICVVVFGLAHAAQGARTVLVIVLLSVGIHGIVRLTGDLYTAMALHFVYDLLAGMVLLHLAKRDGLVPT